MKASFTDKLLKGASLALFSSVAALSPALADPPQESATPSAFVSGTATLDNITVEELQGDALTINTDVTFTVAHDVELTDENDVDPGSSTILITGDGSGAETSLGLVIAAGATVSTSAASTYDVDGDVISISGDVNLAGGIVINGVVTSGGAGAALNLSDAARDSGATITINGSGANGIVTGDILLGDNAGADDALILNDTATVTGDVAGGAGDQSVTFTGAGGSAITDGVDLGDGTGDSINVNLDGQAQTATIGGAVSNVEAINVNLGTLVLNGTVDTSNGGIAIGDGATLRVGATGDVQTDVTNAAGSDGQQIISILQGGTLGTAATVVDLGAGNDVITMTGGTIAAGTLEGGEGTDVISFSSSVATDTALISGNVSGFESINVVTGNVLTLGTGGDTNVTGPVTINLAASGAGLTIDTTGTVTATINGAAGPQLLTLTNGTLIGDVNLAGGADVVTISGGQFGAADRSNTLTLGSDSDIINLNGGILYSSVVTTSGTDIIEVGGDATIAGGVTTGGTIDMHDGVTLTIDSADKTIFANIRENDLVTSDNNLIVNSGTLAGNILFNEGTNSVTFNGGSFTGGYTGGAGNDTITVSLSDPSSSISLGALAFGSGGTDALNVTAGTASFTATVTGSAAMTVGSAGDVVLTAPSTLNVGSYTAAAGATTTFIVRDSATYGNIISSGAAALGNNAVAVNLDSTANVASGTTFNLLTSSGGATDFRNTVITDNSLIINFVNSSTSADTLLVTAIVDDPANILAPRRLGYLAGAASAILATPPGTDSDIDALQSALLTARTARQFSNLVESSAPTVDGGFAASTMKIGDQTADAVTNRLAALRHQNSPTGFSSGDEGKDGKNFWARGFGGTAEQFYREGVDGYSVDQVGGALGFDGDGGIDDLNLGLSFTYGYSKVKSDNINETEAHIDTYLISLYGQKEFEKRFYINALAGYGFNRIDQTRSNVGGTTDDAEGNFETRQFQLYGEGGRDFLLANGFRFTPSVLASFMSVNPDEYEEDEAGGIGLAVSPGTVRSLELGTSLDVSWEHYTNGGMVQPTLHAGYRYDVIGDPISMNASFLGGSPSFSVEGADPAQHRIELGSSLSYYTLSDWSFTGSYLFDTKDDYIGHSGFFKAAYKF